MNITELKELKEMQRKNNNVFNKWKRVMMMMIKANFAAMRIAYNSIGHSTDFPDDRTKQTS